MLKFIALGIIVGIGYFLLSGNEPLVEVSARVPACEEESNKDACEKALKASKQAAKASGELVEAVGDIKK